MINRIFLLLILSVPIYVFYCVGKNRYLSALTILIFSLTFDIGYILRRFDLYLGLNAIIIIAIFSAKLFKGQFNLVSLSKISLKLRVLYFFIVYGLVLSFLQRETVISLDKITFQSMKISSLVQILNVSLWIILLALFIKIIFGFCIKNDYNRIKLQNAFVLSAPIHLLYSTIVYNNLGLQIFFGSLLKLRNSYRATYYFFRFSGLLDSYEMVVDFSLIVIAFSLISQSKMIRIVGIGSAIILGIMTGTRSFVVSLFIFIFSFFVFKIMKKKSIITILKVVALIVIFGIGSFYFYLHFLQNTVLVERLNETMVLISQGEYNKATNRGYDSLFSLLREIPVWGFGSFYLYSINGNSLVTHNLFIAVYAKYGIIGFSYVIYLFYYLFVNLFKIMQSNKSRIIIYQSQIYISLLLALLAQQQKINAIRYLTTILMYGFVFIVMYSFIRRFRNV